MNHLGTDLESFLRFVQYRQGSSKTTLITYRSNLREFLTYLDNRSLSIEEINNYADVISRRDYKLKTFRNKLTIIRCYVQYLYIHNLTDIRPEQIILPKLRDTEATFLTSEEVTQMLKVIRNLKDKTIVLFLLTSGIRVSELVNIQLEDVIDRSVIIRNGKGGKNRLVFISLQTERYLKRYLKVRGTKPGYLFLNYLGGSLSRQIVSRKVTEYAKLAGITKNVSAHTLRHTMATEMLRNGGRLEDVQQILGHANIRTTMIYLHFTNDHLKNSYNQIMLMQNY